MMYLAVILGWSCGPSIFGFGLDKAPEKIKPLLCAPSWTAERYASRDGALAAISSEVGPFGLGVVIQVPAGSATIMPFRWEAHPDTGKK